jgi:hypothetical protein
MANATATLTVNGHPNGVDNTQRQQILYGICLLLAGGTYVTNGIPLPWGAMLSATGGRFIPESNASQPQAAYFFSEGGGAYQYNYDQTHNTLRIIAAGTELANGAAITADTIGFEAHFVRGY